MKFRYGKAVLAVATAMCLANAAYAEDAAPAEEKKSILGDWIPGTFSATISGFTDYSFRGVSQTQTGFAGQMGMTWKQDCGFYIGTWGSNLHYGGTDDANWEQDILMGYTNAVGNLTYDVHATSYVYPKASKYDYFEFQAGGAYNINDIATVRASALFSPDYFGILNNAGYFLFGFNVPIPIPENRFASVSVDGNLGYTVSDQAVYGSNNNYLDWNLGIILAVSKNISFDLRYVDTDLNIGSIADQRFVGGATLSF